MKYSTFLISLLLLGINGISQSLYFPPIDSDEWETISPEALGWCTDEIPELYDYLESKNTKAFLVLKDGKIVLEKYFDTFTKDSLWYWASAGKTVTSVLTGIAQQEGLLSLDEPTSTYLGEGWTNCTAEQELAITVRNQLSMNSGLDDGLGVFCTDPECLEHLADAGERWAYHNAPYTLLSEVISEASGLPYNAFCNTRLEANTGMSGTFVPVDPNLVYFSIPRDMARFGLMVLNEGYWDGEGVLTDAEYFNAMVNTSNEHNLSYGYLWWLNGKSSFMMPQSEAVFDGSIMNNAPDDMFAALGKNDQILNVVPSQNLIVVRMGENPGGIEDLVPLALNNTIWDYLNGIMCEVSAVNSSDLPELKLFPNPATNQISFNYPEQGNYSINNLAGQEIMSGIITVGKQTVNIDDLKPGHYILTINDSENTRKIQFIVL